MFLFFPLVFAFGSRTKIVEEVKKDLEEGIRIKRALGGSPLWPTDRPKIAVRSRKCRVEPQRRVWKQEAMEF